MRYLLKICQCLMNLEEDSSLGEHEGAVSTTDTFDAYTSAWLDIIDRGGLFKISLTFFFACFPSLLEDLDRLLGAVTVVIFTIYVD